MHNLKIGQKVYNTSNLNMFFNVLKSNHIFTNIEHNETVIVSFSSDDKYFSTKDRPDSNFCVNTGVHIGSDSGAFSKSYVFSKELYIEEIEKERIIAEEKIQSFCNNLIAEKEREIEKLKLDLISLKNRNSVQWSVFKERDLYLNTLK